MIKIKENIAGTIYNAVSGIWKAADVPAVSEITAMLEYPPEEKMGDIAFPCFKLSRALRTAPPVIAAKIYETILKNPPEGISKCETAGGYLNFFVSDLYLSADLLSEILEKGEKYGAHDFGIGKTVVLDYSSPNVAKPFHIGHLGTTVIGHSLKKLHEYCGYKCVGINHLGDWGTQFGKLIVAYRLWGNKEKIERDGIDELVSLYVKFHEEAEKDESLENAARHEFSKLEKGDEENISLWKWFKEVSITEYKKTYKQLGIEFESYCGESFYSDKMPEQIELLKQKGLLKLDDGMLIVDLSQYGMPPCLILKSDGTTIYPTRDIAAAVYRKRTYDFDKCIYVTSAGQSLHFAQWIKVVELMGYEWFNKLIHVPYGTVSINGEKLATRTGNVILLKDLFAQSIEKVRGVIEEKNPGMENKDETAEAVGVGAIVFYYLTNNRMRDINFSMEEALDFNGNTGPYVQYTYARACSVLSRVREINVNSKGKKPLEKTERDLLKMLSLFPEKTLDAIRELEPSIIARYTLDVCNCFNRFYQECPIATAEDENTRAFRASLTLAVKYVTGSVLELVCMKHPTKI